MLTGRKACLFLFALIFSLFISLLFFVGVSKADPPVINGSNPNPSQMSGGGSQTFTATGGCDEYRWSINGALVGTTGNSVTYTAPTTNPNCANNPTICVTDSCGQKTCKQTAVNAASASYLAYTFTEIHDRSGYFPALSADWSMNWLGYNCNGVHVVGDNCGGSCGSWCPDLSMDLRSCTPPGSGPCWGGYCPDNTNGYCTRDRAVADCSAMNGCGINYGLTLNCDGITDLRTDAQKAAGCCPAAMLPPTPPEPPTPPAPTTPDTNDTGNNCNNSAPAESSANLKSGNLYHSQNVAGITLSYNSLDTINGVLGAKWTHNYNQQLTALSDNVTLTLRTEDDDYIYFRLSGGIYYPDAISGDTSSIVQNANSTFTRTAKNGTIYNYNSAGQLTSITNRNGNATTLIYSNGYLAGITDPNGRTTTIATAGGTITSITDPGGRIYNLAYANGLLTSITDPLGNAWQYTYDATGKMLTEKDPANNIITYAYDSSGKLLTSTDPEGKTRSMNYTQSGSTTFTEKDGGVWSYTYDQKYAVKTAKTDPLGNTTTYTYDSNRNLLTTTYPDGTTTSNTYDQNSNLTSVTDALGNKTTYTYNSLNLVTSITDASGKQTQYSYDAKGNVISTTDPSGAITQYTYDAKGNITTITSPNGGITKMAYDQNNNLISITDPAGQTTTQAYDSLGNMISQINALGNITAYQYDSLNHLIKVTDSAGKITQYTYDANGNRSSTTDANGNTTKYAYNYKNQLIQTTDALGNVTNFTYGTSGCSTCGGGTDKLTAVTDAKGQTTTYQYDLNGNLIKETDPLGNFTTYTYDARGNMITKTKPDGRTINYIYDALNRLVTRKYPNNTADVFQYDQAGNVITATTNQNIAYYYSYDADNRIIGITDSNLREIKYQYDIAGNRTSMITPEGKTIKYEYNVNNQMTRIATDKGNYTFSYDSLNRRIKRTLPNHTSTTYAYDRNSRLTSITHKNAFNQTIDSFGYTYDNIGNRIARSDSNKTINYNYDQIYRLTKTTPKSKNPLINLLDDILKLNTEAYSYDPVGNRQTGPQANDSYTYDSGNEQLTYKGKVLILDKNDQNQYDVNGNLIKKTENIKGQPQIITTYAYDDENRLTDVKIQQGDKIKEVIFTYDPFGRRISKTVQREEFDDDDKDRREHHKKDYPKTTYYVYNNQNIIAEYDPRGKLIASYIHGPNTDEPLSAEIHNDWIFYHADGLGSITALTNFMGNAIQRYAYDSFGNIKHNPHPRWITQPYTYTAREMDYETGLYYYRARYYDPKAGRFTTKDPIGFDGGDVNLYAYVSNNPVNYIDPQGLFSNHSYLSLQAFNQVECKKLYNEAASASQEVDALSGTNDVGNVSWHAMSNGQINESPVTAARNTENYINNQLSLCSARGLGYALHAEQDKYAGGHRGYQPWYGGLPTYQHWKADTFNSDTLGAINASIQLIRKFKEVCPCACQE